MRARVDQGWSVELFQALVQGMVFGDMVVSEHEIHYWAADEDETDILVDLGSEFEQFLAEQV